MYEYILGLDVPVDDSLLEELVVAVRELAQKVDYLLLRQVLVLLDLVLERAPVAVVHDEVTVFLRLHLQRAVVNQVGVGLQLLQDLQLSFDRPGFVGLLNRDDFGHHRILRI